MLKKICKNTLFLDKKSRVTKFSGAFFEVCVKPATGSVITGAFFHLPPFVNVDKKTGEKVSLNPYNI